uniref:coiled-coil domain-containing protein 9 n=1 Tax=Euleptes europaea TaxID=460621 RepID=UPI00253FE763|nr:coiled-coil domain-containing protein 9 [Euleptes europaea]
MAANRVGRRLGRASPARSGGLSPGSASADLKSKEEKDAELDKRIEALRRKNQALIKRYQEIEEDRKKAEQEGIAVTGARRAPPADVPHVAERRQGEMAGATLTVQVLLSPEEKRVVSDERKPHVSHRALRGNPNARGSARGGPGLGRVSPRAECRPEQSSWEGAEGDGTGIGKRGRGGRRPRGRGGPAGEAGPDRRSKEWEERRRQNIEKMNEEMEKIAEYERSQRDGLQERNPVRNFLDDPRRSGPFAESDRREGSRRHIRNWGGADFDKIKTGMEQGKAWPPPGRGSARCREETLDMTLSMTGRERAEYIRWKQEREQIDRERLARHRQATGEWRREWDAEKMDTMFKEGAKPGGSLGHKQEESKRPPKMPTLGAFLPEHQPQRRRKGRGRGHARGAPPKPYSRHDNRWEEEEAEEMGPEAAPAEAKAHSAPVRQEELPASPHAAPDEDEDQWEDVSEGEEGEDEGSVSQGASSVAEEEEDEAPPSSPQVLTAKPPGRDGPSPLAMPPSEPETSNAEGKPVTPFSPVEGYHPVSDWGEEMELSSPQAHCTKSPLAPLADGAVGPPPGALVEERGEGPRAPTPEEGTTTEPGEQGAAMDPAQRLAPSSSSSSSSSMAEFPEGQQTRPVLRTGDPEPTLRVTRASRRRPLDGSGAARRALLRQELGGPAGAAGPRNDRLTLNWGPAHFSSSALLSRGPWVSVPAQKGASLRPASGDALAPPRARAGCRGQRLGRASSAQGSMAKRRRPGSVAVARAEVRGCQAPSRRTQSPPAPTPFAGCKCSGSPSRRGRSLARAPRPAAAGDRRASGERELVWQGGDQGSPRPCSGALHGWEKRVLGEEAEGSAPSEEPAPIGRNPAEQRCDTAETAEELRKGPGWALPIPRLRDCGRDDGPGWAAGLGCSRGAGEGRGGARGKGARGGARPGERAATPRHRSSWAGQRSRTDFSAAARRRRARELPRRTAFWPLSGSGARRAP